MKRRTFQLESLELRKLMTATVTEIEPNDSRSGATRFAIGTEPTALVGSINDEDDRDYFSTVADRGGELNLRVQSSNGNIPQILVETPSGVTLLETEPNDGVNQGKLTVQAGDRLFVRLKGTNDSLSQYTATLGFGNLGGGGGNVPVGTVTEVETNDRIGQATEFALDAQEQGVLRGVSVSGDDKDYFKLVAPRSGTFHVSVVSDPAGSLAQLQIENAQGDAIFATNANNRVHDGTISVTTGQTLFIRLRSTDDAPATYTAYVGFGQLNVPLPTGNITETEVNDRLGQAHRFRLDSQGQATLRGVSASDDDKDYFQLVAPRTGTMNLAVLSVSNGSLAQIQVEDASGNAIFETNVNDGMNEGSIEVTEGQTLFLRLRSTDKGAAVYTAYVGFGELNIPYPVGNMTEVESNDRIRHALRFKLDAQHQATLLGTSQNSDDKDYFALVAPVTGSLHLDVTTKDNIPVQLQVEDAAGDKLFENNANDGINDGILLVRAGQRLNIRLRSKDDVPTDYTVKLALTPGPTADAGDANGDGQVDFQDFLRMAQYFGQSDRFREHGDFTDDHIVDFVDFLMMSQNFGKSNKMFSS